MAAQLASPNEIQALDNELKNQINSIYKELQTNISDVDSLKERRERLVTTLAGLYEQRVKLGTLVNEETRERISVHQICIAIHTDMAKNKVPIYCYSKIASILPKKYKKPYQFHKLDNDVDEKGNKTGFTAEITELDMDKGSLKSYKKKIPNIEDYAVDGTPYIVSQIKFEEALSNIGKAKKQLKNLSELQPAHISALALYLKDNYEVVKKYCNAYSIKIPGEKKPSKSSVSLNLEKPYFRKQMLHDEIKLLEKDLAVIRKGSDQLIMTEDEEYLYWEAIRGVRMYIRPDANQKYRRHWFAYAEILKVLRHKNMSGVAKNDTLGVGKIYDPEKKAYVDVEELMEGGVSGVKKLKGISRNHLRNMSHFKLADVFTDIILDIPFLQDLAYNFESQLQPLRDGKAIMMTR